MTVNASLADHIPTQQTTALSLHTINGYLTSRPWHARVSKHAISTCTLQAWVFRRTVTIWIH